MRKNVFLVIFALVLTLGLVGCGTSEPTKPSTDSIDYNENIDKTEGSTTEYENTETTDSSSNESSTEVTTKPTSQNIEDYWQGSDYFDLEGYVTAMGGTNYKVEEFSGYHAYSGGCGATFTYNGWNFTIPFVSSQNEQCSGCDIIFENDSKYVTASLPSLTEAITIDSQGNTFSRNLEDILKMVFEDINNSSNSTDCPCCSAGHSTGASYVPGESFNHYCLGGHHWS